MGNEVDNKFTWVIEDFSSLGSKIIYSDEFVVGGCRWRLKAYPKGNNNGELEEHWFDEKEPDWGYKCMIDIGELKFKIGGFLVNGEVKIVAEVVVLNVIGELDVPKETEGTTQPLKKIKMNDDDGVVTTDLLKEVHADWVDVNGFQVLPSQVEYVKRIFGKHPDMALECRAKNQNLKTACMNVLLNLIKTLCQSLQDLSVDDLGLADSALTYLKYSGFKVDWLEQKLVEVKGNKKEEQIGVTRIQELNEYLKVIKQKCSEEEALLEKEKVELKDLKQRCSDIEAMLEKEKAKVLAAIATPYSTNVG